MREAVTVKIERKVDREKIAGLLCSAFEGGVGYWCRIMDYREPPKGAAVEIFGQDYTDFPLTGGAVICRRYEEETDEKYTPLVLDGAAIERGLALLANPREGVTGWSGKHWSDFLSDDCDATTGDVFVQLCLLGAVEYG